MTGADEFTVLVVDDSKLIRASLRNMLSDIKINNVMEASNGRDALGILQVFEVNLIISDWNMPEMSGVQFLQEVRGNDKTSKIPFLMVTGESEKEKVLYAVQAGVNNYIIKPFSAETLYKKIAAFLPQKE